MQNIITKTERRLGEGNFINNKQHGEWVYKNNNTITSYIYDNGLLLSPATVQYLNDADQVWMIVESPLKNNKFNGLAHFYLIDDGHKQLIAKKNFVDDSLNGFFIEALADSTVVGFHKNDQLHGEIKIYKDQLAEVMGTNYGYELDTTTLQLCKKSMYKDGVKNV